MQYWTLNIISFIQFPKANEGKLLQPSEWYHVAVTYDTEAKTAAIYVDGKLKTTELVSPLICTSKTEEKTLCLK